MSYSYDPDNGFQRDENGRSYRGNYSGSRTNYNYSSNGGNRPKKNDNDAGSWVFIAIMFLVGLWPVGLILLISKLANSAGNYAKKHPQQAQMGASAQDDRGGARTRTQQTRAKVTQTPQYSAKGAGAMRVVGIVLLCVGILAILGMLGQGFELLSLLYTSGIALGGLALWGGGIVMSRRARRFAKYTAIIGAEASIPLSRLASSVNVSEKRVSRDLELMIEKGLWGEEAYVDLGEGMFFRTREAYDLYAEHKAGAKKKAAPVSEEAEEGYSGILRNIRRANDNIADPVLSAKIDRLEEVAGKIFRAIEADPAKKEKAGTFLNYYLPTTQKLLDSYAEFEAAGVQGENLEAAKAKIQKTMDAIVVGFEHQLDELYQSNAMDVESDIRVMETMLRRDGASVEKDFGLGGSAAVQMDGETGE